jgi:hypothetical protein
LRRGLLRDETGALVVRKQLRGLRGKVTTDREPVKVAPRTTDRFQARTDSKTIRFQSERLGEARRAQPRALSREIYSRPRKTLLPLSPPPGPPSPHGGRGGTRARFLHLPATSEPPLPPPLGAGFRPIAPLKVEEKQRRRERVGATGCFRRGVPHCPTAAPQRARGGEGGDGFFKAARSKREREREREQASSWGRRTGRSGRGREGEEAKSGGLGEGAGGGRGGGSCFERFHSSMVPDYPSFCYRVAQPPAAPLPPSSPRPRSSPRFASSSHFGIGQAFFYTIDPPVPASRATDSLHHACASSRA